MKRGWKIKKLGEVCQYEKIPNKRSTLPYVGLEDIESNTGRFTGSLEPKNAKSLTFYFTPEHVLYGRLRPYLNKVLLPDFEGHCSTEIFPIKPKSILDKKYLFRWLTFNKTVDKINATWSGATLPRANMNAVLDFEIPLPPLVEQKSILEILDEVFASITKAKANVEQNLKNAKELFESYLQSVFDKKDPNWVISSIGETCNLLTGGTPSRNRKEYFEGGNIKWLVSGDINQKVIYECEGRITELGLENSNARFLPLNSILIALNGQGKTRGTVAMLKTKATCNQSLVAIHPKNDKSLLPELVYANLEGRYIEIRKITGDSGNDRRGLNMPLIRQIKFSYPKKIEEQQRIIQKLDNLRAETKRLVAMYQQKLYDLEELKKSLLQKAFNGELKTS